MRELVACGETAERTKDAFRSAVSGYVDIVGMRRFPTLLKFDRFMPLVPSCIGVSPSHHGNGFNSSVEAPSALEVSRGETKNNNRIHFEAPSGCLFLFERSRPTHSRVGNMRRTSGWPLV